MFACILVCNAIIIVITCVCQCDSIKNLDDDEMMMMMMMTQDAHFAAESKSETLCTVLYYRKTSSFAYKRQRRVSGPRREA